MTRITTPFGAESTAADVIACIDLNGRRAIVTGGASGIGIETARVLATAGADVTIAVRDTAAGQKVAADIGRDVAVAHLDLADPESVAAFAGEWDGPLHLLVNNARRDGHPPGDEPVRLGAAVGDQPPRPLRPGERAALGAGSRGRTSGQRQLARPPVLRRPSRRPELPAPSVRPVAGVRPEQDCQHPVRGGGKPALGADGITVNALHPGRIMTNLIRHLDPGMLAEIRATSGGADQIKTDRAGRRDVDPGRHLAIARGYRWSLLRRLQRSRGQRRGNPHRSGRVRPRPRQRRGPLDRLARPGEGRRMKTWFITGTSRGFGREWTIAALERGDRVAATARNVSRSRTWRTSTATACSRSRSTSPTALPPSTAVAAGA